MNLDNGSALEAKAERDTILAQLGSPRTKFDVIAISLGRLLDILEGIEGNAAAARLLETSDVIFVSTDPSDHVYGWIAPKARIVKSVLQMSIGAWAVFWLLGYFWNSRRHLTCPSGSTFCYPIPLASHVFALIADALAAAAVVELAYTLFTPGPDEALDPLMLGLSAALLFLLSKLQNFHTGEAVAALLYATTLGILFLVRLFLATDAERESLPWWYPRRLRSRTPAERPRRRP